MILSLPNSYCSKAQSLVLLQGKPAGRRPRLVRMDSTTRRHRRKDKVIVIMGATGTGKSRLSIEIATQFPSEIINSDKMQVYEGLDITTNKIPMHERFGVPHHLLGEINSSNGELSPSEYRSRAASAVSAIWARRRLPLIVGGSNSFIHALLSGRFDPESDRLDGFGSVSSELRYNCCFLWVDVSFAVLDEYLRRRVDDMLDAGMFQELAEFYDPEADPEKTRQVGIRKAIGVPEFDRYFRSFPPDRGGCGQKTTAAHLGGDLARRKLYEEAVVTIKNNTSELAKRQIEKILRLRSAGWDLRRLDSTEAFRLVLMSDSGKASEIWKKEVMEPSLKIMKHFLEELGGGSDHDDQFWSSKRCLVDGVSTSVREKLAQIYEI